jgi:hypothetical protein
MAIDQRQLNPELSEWLENRQKQLKIVKTTRTPSGQILDWISIESQFPDGKVPSPPPADLIPSHVQDKSRPMKPARLELDDPAVERGPARSGDDKLFPRDEQSVNTVVWMRWDAERLGSGDQ